MTNKMPRPRELFGCVLRVLARGERGVLRMPLFDAVADEAQLTAEQRANRIPSGALTYRHRTGWALTMLRRAGYVDSPSRGVWAITDEGRKLIAANPNGLPRDVVLHIVQVSREIEGGADESPSVTEDGADTTTPLERIEGAATGIRAAVALELLEQIGKGSPSAFEELVLKVLHAVGYGSSIDDVQRVGGTGDGGIDGVIALDKLGLEKVYVQAKRWKGTVGRPDIQSFYGALAGRRARKGVFITTSGYTREAREFAENVSDSIVLIDGPRFAHLMIDHGVGVQVERTIIVPKVDLDFFEDA